MTRKTLNPYRLHIVLLMAVAGGIAAAFSLPQIAQDPTYHDFADKRAWLGIANFGDVAGNLPFILMGLLGFQAALAKGKELKAPARLMWITFFLGVFLTGFGSGYYHLAPDNGRLVFDRLPMTIAFMSFLSIIISERINEKAGLWLFPLLLGMGIFSVWYWHYTETLLRGDLRLYALVQFLPMIVIPLIIWLFPAAHKNTRCLFYTLAFYMLAKLLEHFDQQIFSVTGHLVSGHTLKHIAAAAGIVWIVQYLKKLPAAS